MLTVKSKILDNVGELQHGSTTKQFNPYYISKGIDIQKFFSFFPNPPQIIIFLDQIHSSTVFHLKNESQINNLKKINEKLYQVPSADGIVVKALKNILIVISTADCLPVLLYDKKLQTFGGVHAGWKGTKGRILEYAISTMKNGGSNPNDILVWVGPAIGLCCYEVSNELIDEFKSEFKEWSGFTNGRKLDLKKLNYLQAIKCGVNPQNIEISEYCTLCSNNLFHSYRNNGEKSGRIFTYMQI